MRLQEERAELFGGPAVNGFCPAAAQPGQGKQPQTGALTAAADLPDCEGDEHDSSGKPTFQEYSSCSVRPLSRLVARLPRTRWAAIQQPLKHTLLILPVTFGHAVPKSVRTARTSIATCSSASKRLFARDANDANDCTSPVISCTDGG